MADYLEIFAALKKAAKKVVALELCAEPTGVCEMAEKLAGTTALWLEYGSAAMLVKMTAELKDAQ